VIHPVEQSGTGLPDELLFELRERPVLPSALIKEIEARSFGFGVPLPVKALRLVHVSLQRDVDNVKGTLLSHILNFGQVF
jgi:hypothetical protein